MLKTIDLFAGAGGLSLGFKMTGQFELVAAAEINANAKATYKKNLVGNNDVLAGDTRDVGSIPGLGRYPGEGHGNPLHYSCLENPMDRGAGGLHSLGSQRAGHD